MTAFYKMPGFTLANASLSTRLLVTLFLLAVAAGLVVSLLQYGERAGLGAGAAEEWLLGNESDPSAREIKVEKSDRELLSITHEHAFALPILLFVLLHLVALCTIPDGAKIALYSVTFGAYACSLGGIWLTARADPAWSLLLRVGGMVMTACIALGCALPLFEMWLARPLRRRRGRPEPEAPNPMFPKRAAE